jgi:predicted PurR-regulated permease PerM
VKPQPPKPDRAEYQDGAWPRYLPSQVRPLTVAVVILTAVVVLSGLYLLWQLRHIVVWFVIALFVAAALNPYVTWLQQRRVKRSLAILLTYVGLLVGAVGLVALVLPALISEVQALIGFITTLAQDPGGWIGSLEDFASRYGLGSLADALVEQLGELPERLAQLVESFLLSAGGLLVGASDFVVAFITILVIAFFLLLESERFVNTGLQLFDEPQRPRVRRILNRSAGAVSGYITGNLTISLICGVGVYIVLLLLGMPYAAALALIVAVLDLIPFVGAPLGGAMLVIVSLFIDPFASLVLLVYFVIYKLVEDYILTPVIYSRSVQLHPLAIFLAILAGGVLYGVLGALLAIPIAEIIRILGAEWLAARTQQSRSPPGE